MDEFERRLRSAFTEMAEEVSPSHDAWAEQQRRLAVKSRRTMRPAALVAAAAAAVAVIAVPFLMFGGAKQVDPAATPPALTEETTTPPLPSTSREPEFQPEAGFELVGTPSPNAQFVEGNRSWQAWVYLKRAAKAPAKSQDFVCTSAVPPGAPVNGPERFQDRSPECTPYSAPANGKQVWLQRPLFEKVLGATKIGDGQTLFVTSTMGEKVLVRTTAGDYQAGQRVGTTDQVHLFIVSIAPSTMPIKAYTVMDAAGQPLEHG